MVSSPPPVAPGPGVPSFCEIIIVSLNEILQVI